jgi:hypothetical protein
VQHLIPCVEVYWASQVVYSIFFLVWNLLVAVVLVSVARTQTIRIRRYSLLKKQLFMLINNPTFNYFVF